jgi:hypothetical protein
LRLFAAAIMIASAAAAGWWIAVRATSTHDDCGVVRQMLDYSRAESNRLIATGIDTIGDDPQKVASDYTVWAETMHTYADRIEDVTLHQNATALATTDSDFVNVWKRAALHPEPATVDSAPSASDKVLSQQYREFAEKQRQLTVELLGRCP